MGKKSKYYKQLRREKLALIEQLKMQLPIHTHSYIDNLVLENQPGTALGYSRDLLCFYEYLHYANPIVSKYKIRDIPHNIIEQLSFLDINSYQTYLYTTKLLCERSAARKMAAVRNYFAYEAKNGFILEDITLKAAGNKKATKRTITRLDQHDVKSLMHTVEYTEIKSAHSRTYSEATSKRDLAIITILLNTGMRVSELAGLDLDDANFKENTLRIVRKGGDESKLFMNELIRNTLRDYIATERPSLIETDDEPALFISLKHSRLSVRSIQRMVEKFGDKAGIEGHLSPHKLRRTYGTTLYNKTGDIYLVADVLGHKDINTTAAHYAAIDEQHKREAADIDLYSNEEPKD